MIGGNTFYPYVFSALNEIFKLDIIIIVGKIQYYYAKFQLALGKL